MVTVLCGIVKNEQRFIREWVEHYLRIGFSRLYIYEDYGSDTHKEQIQDYIDKGKVELVNLEETGFVRRFGRGTVTQSMLYNKFLKLCRAGAIQADWVGFFDVDEFMMFEAGWNLQRLEEAFKEYGGILLAWKLYGANGHIKRPEGNVVDNYTSHLSEGSTLDGNPKWNVKSFVNIKNCSTMPCIHRFEGCVATNYSEEETLCFEKAWLNHYYSKSWEDYCDRIFNRGNMNNNARSLDQFFTVSPEFYDKREEMIMAQRYNRPAGTVWVSREFGIAGGGNIIIQQD